MLRSAHIASCLPIPLLIVLEWGQFQSGMGWCGIRLSLLEIYFARNCTKCPELYRKVMFADIHLHCSGIGMEVGSLKLFLLKTE